MLCCVHCQSSNGNCAILSRGPHETPPVDSFSSHPSALLRDSASNYLQYKSKLLKNVRHCMTWVLQFSCKDGCVYNLKLRGEPFHKVLHRCTMQSASITAVSLYEEKHHSQLRRMRSIKSNLPASSTACVSGHLWKRTKWLHVRDQPDGDVGFRDANTHTKAGRSKLRGHNKSLMMCWITRSLSESQRFQKQTKERDWLLKLSVSSANYSFS